MGWLDAHNLGEWLLCRWLSVFQKRWGVSLGKKLGMLSDSKTAHQRYIFIQCGCDRFCGMFSILSNNYSSVSDNILLLNDRTFLFNLDNHLTSSCIVYL